MKYIGAHISVTGGVSTAPVSAAEMGMNAFALFTRNPTRWKSKAIPEKEAEAFREHCTRLGFTPDVILPHDSYLINLGSPEPEKLAQSREAFLDEMHRCEQLGLTMLNFHPGSHMRMIDDDDCLKIIAESVNGALAETSGVTAVLESTAGQGSNLGYRFEQLARIIELIDDKSRVGVCVDTCHTFAAGYDLVSDEGYDRTWHEFDSVIGFNYLRALHINDSKKGVGSRVDRHAPIGKGELGSIFFARLMADPRFDNIPLILETPDESLWPAEIEWLRKQAENDSGN